MTDSTEKPKTGRISNSQVHMANERTFLAWMRTSLGIMAFGFVVEKFALFIKKLGHFFGKPDMAETASSSSGYSWLFGVALVAMGGLMGVMAFIRYKQVERDIDNDTYRPSLVLDILVAMGILVIGVFLIFYMIQSS
jgi:uncharacterized membrane protein YidH (DUF202 family)